MWGEVEETLFNIISSLCACCKYGYPSILGELFHVSLGDLRSFSEEGSVSLIPDHNNRDVSIGMFLHFFQPRMQIHKGFSFEHVENEYNPVSPPVIGISNRSVAFLAGGVPNLKFDFFLSMSDAAESLNNKYVNSYEIYSDGGYVIFVEFIVLYYLSDQIILQI